MKNKTIIGIIFALIIIAGIVITCVWGLNFSLSYSAHKEIDIYIRKEFNNQEIYELAKESMPAKEIHVQKVELYEDMVSIQVKDITDKQLESLNTKINEKYGIENKVEEIVVTDIPNVRGRDLVKPYILPMGISFAIIIIYITIYTTIYSHIGKKVDTIKTVGKAIGIIVGVQLIYLALLAITRLEINRLTIPFAIVLFIITTIGILSHLEKKNNQIEK